MRSPIQGQEQPAGHIDFAAWFIRLLTWDGLLPFLVLSVPFVVEAILPNRRGAIEIVSIVVPIIAFLIRGASGLRHIQRNNCSPGMQQLQVLAFFLGIVMLVFFDAVMILRHIMPAGALVPAKEERPILAGIALLYLVLMAFSMFPGGARAEPEVFRPLN